MNLLLDEPGTAAIEDDEAEGFNEEAEVEDDEWEDEGVSQSRRAEKTRSARLGEEMPRRTMRMMIWMKRGSEEGEWGEERGSEAK